MENKAVFKKFPALLVVVSVFGIAVMILMIIASIGKVKIPVYFGFFMNLLFYANVLIFALNGYRNEKSITKKPVKNLLKSFCILLIMVTIAFPPIHASVAVIFGIVIVLDIIMMKNIKNLKMCRVIVFVILALLLVAAFIKLSIFGHMPGELLPRGVWCFNVYNQVIQWIAFGMTYILRFGEFDRAGYLD